MQEDSPKKRADVALVERGLAPSRERARALIEAGQVTLNGRPVAKPAALVAPGEALCVTGDVCPYVSRGGLKLEKALSAFSVDARDRVCMDLGASTGGFTDVLLQNGARRVYAVDVGTGQLDARLRADPRVTSMERVNARAIERSMFPVLPSLCAMDLSFISIRLVLPAARSVMGEEGRILTLVKPQFEAGRQHVGKKGVVSDGRIHISVLNGLLEFAGAEGFSVGGLDFSPITGPEGNIEFLMDLRCAPGPARPFDVRELVEHAHAAHKKRAL